MKNYTTVETKIGSIVKAMNADATYLFMNWAQANEAIDDIDRPTIVYILPPSGKLTVTWARILDSPEAQIAFLSPTDFDFNGSENDNIIEQMKRLCIRFIKAFNASGLFEPIEGELPYQVLYDHLDHNVTGIVITPIVKEIDGVSLCNDNQTREGELWND